jgi:hypothetical protein
MAARSSRATSSVSSSASSRLSWGSSRAGSQGGYDVSALDCPLGDRVPLALRGRRCSSLGAARRFRVWSETLNLLVLRRASSGRSRTASSRSSRSSSRLAVTMPPYSLPAASAGGDVAIAARGSRQCFERSRYSPTNAGEEGYSCAGGLQPPSSWLRPGQSRRPSSVARRSGAHEHRIQGAERERRVGLHDPGGHEARPETRLRSRNVRALSAGLRHRWRVRAGRPDQHVPERLWSRADGHRLALFDDLAAKLGQALEGRGSEQGGRRRRFLRRPHRPSDDRSRERALLLPCRDPALGEPLDPLDRRRERQGARQDRRHRGRPQHRRER